MHIERYIKGQGSRTGRAYFIRFKGYSVIGFGMRADFGASLGSRFLERSCEMLVMCILKVILIRFVIGHFDYKFIFLDTH